METVWAAGAIRRVLQGKHRSACGVGETEEVDGCAVQLREGVQGGEVGGRVIDSYRPKGG